MDTTTSVIATGVVVTVGTWANKKQLTMKTFIGLGAVTIFLAVMQASNSKLAEQFALLILVSAVLIYGVQIGKTLGGLK